MATAGARTNSIGGAINGNESLGDLSCKTDSFTVESIDTNSGIFEDPNKFTLDETVALSFLLGHKNDHVQLIASTLFENGIGLAVPIKVYKFRKVYPPKDDEKESYKWVWEVRTKKERFIVVSGRVCSLLNKR